MIKIFKVLFILILIRTRNPWWSLSSKVAYILLINIILGLASPNTALCHSYDLIVDDIPEWTDPRPENEQYLEPLPQNFSHREVTRNGSTFTYYGDYSVQYTKADGTSTTRIFALSPNTDSEINTEIATETEVETTTNYEIQYINFLSEPSDTLVDYNNKIFNQNFTEDEKLLAGLNYVNKLVPSDIWPTTKSSMLNRSSSFNLYRDNFQETILSSKKLSPQELERLVHFLSSYTTNAFCKVNGADGQLTVLSMARAIHERLQRTLTL